MAIDRAQQALWGRVGGLRTAARHDAKSITAPARRAFEARFYQGIPEGLPTAERERRAAAARAAFYADLTARSVAARKRAPVGVGKGVGPIVGAAGRTESDRETVGPGAVPQA
jgi:hypothetical protein